jgi:hypothetical protein
LAGFFEEQLHSAIATITAMHCHPGDRATLAGSKIVFLFLSIGSFIIGPQEPAFRASGILTETSKSPGANLTRSGCPAD